MRALTSTVIGLVVCAWSPLGRAQPPLTPNPFVEQVRAASPSAGEIFRGFEPGASASPVSVDALRVVLPPGPAAVLCVTLETQDARYFAQGTYAIAVAARPQTQSLQLPTEYRSLLESVAQNELSVIAYLAANCQSTDGTYVRAYFGSTPTTESPLVVLVNSRTPDVSVRVFHQETRRYFPCADDPADSRRVAFNMRCEVTLPSPGEATLVIVRNRAERQLPPVRVVSYLP